MKIEKRRARASTTHTYNGVTVCAYVGTCACAQYTAFIASSCLGCGREAPPDFGALARRRWLVLLAPVSQGGRHAAAVRSMSFYTPRVYSRTVTRLNISSTMFVLTNAGRNDCDIRLPLIHIIAYEKRFSILL